MVLAGCCGCFNLKDGSAAVGITMLVLHTIGLVGCLVGVAILGSAASDSDKEKEAVNFILYVLIGVLLLVVIFVLIDALLIHGVRTARSCLVLTWLIFYGIIFSLNAIGAVVNCITTFAAGAGALIVPALLQIGVVAVFWYWWTVVLHFRRTINSFTYRNQEMKNLPSTFSAA